MQKRVKTKQIRVGNLLLGGQNKILIQSMCDIKTSNTKEVISQINECARLGADLMRVSILDMDDAKAIKEIKSHINIPIVCDFHYTTNLVETAIKSGADKIRINPVNTAQNELIKIIDLCKEYKVPIRIGLNEGSLNKDKKSIHSIKGLIDLCLETIDFFESHGFYDLVLSIKSSDPLKTVKIYEKLSRVTNYPLHIGVTESGFEDIGIIRSTIALSRLILNGIGDTIRVSLTKNPPLEVITAKRLLHDCGLYPNYPTIISCPTCGRCKVKNLDKIAKTITKYLEENSINIKISIMGCIVNGIGEGKNSDIGVAGENGAFIIFKKGKILKEVKEENLLDELIKVIEKEK